MAIRNSIQARFMKRIVAMLIGLVAFAVPGSLLGQNVSVTATAGTAGPTLYSTVSAAFTAINGGTHQGAITISLTGNVTETAAAVLNSSGAGSAVYTSVLIRPTADAVTLSGPTVTGRGLIELNGADNVTIDGDNPNSAGTNRNLTITNSAATSVTFTSVIRVATSTTVTTANNISIRNCIINGSGTSYNASGNTSFTATQAGTNGIYVGAGASTVAATTAPNALSSNFTNSASGQTFTNLSITNNQIGSCGKGIAVCASATSVCPVLTINDNVIGNPTAGNANQVYWRGIIAQGFGSSPGSSISGNTIYVEGFSGSTSAPFGLVGIDLGTGTGTAAGVGGDITVSRNQILRVRHNNTGGFPAVGISLQVGNGVRVENNYITNVLNVGSGSLSTTYGAQGIRVLTGNNHTIYHNSVALSGSDAGAGNLITCLSFAGVATTGCNVRNNIFSNTCTSSSTTSSFVGVYFTTAPTSGMALTMNNNAYYTGTTASLSGVGQVTITKNATNLYTAANFAPGATTPSTNWRAITSVSSANNDNASFAATTAAPFTSATNLKINTAASGVGALFATGASGTGVTTDIEGDTRATTPTIGADEFTLQAQCATTPVPTDAATGVLQTQVLSWAAGTFATQYDVYFEAANPPTALVSANQAGLSYNPGTLAPNTTFFWQVIPKNAGGSATGCPVWSFTTQGAVPSLTATALSAFGSTCLNVTSTSNSFSMTGLNLTGTDVTITAPAGFTVSENGSDFFSSINVAHTAGAFSGKQIFVRFTPTATGVTSGSITINGGGLSADVLVAASGTGVNTPATVSLNGTAGSITSSGATISGSTISVIGCSAVTAYGIEWSTTNNFTPGTGTQVAGTGFSGSAGGTFTTTLTGLSSNTLIYYRAFATNAGGTAYGATQASFTTLCGSFPAPTVVETFSTFPPSCWLRATGAPTASTTLSGTSSEWLVATNFANATGGGGAVKTNLYGTNTGEWFISPQIDLGTTPGLYQVKYRWAVTTFDGTGTVSTLGSQIVRVIVSTDGGATWNVANTLKTYTGAVPAPASTYSNTGETETISLAAYSGVVRIAFVSTTNTTAIDIDFHVDNFQVEAAPACTGTPTPGNTTTSASALCSGGATTVNLGLQNATIGTGVTYQWQSSSTQFGTYTTISGSPSAPTYTATAATGTTWYRCIVTCAGNDGISTPVSVTVADCNYTITRNTGITYSSIMSTGTDYTAFTNSAGAASTSADDFRTNTVSLSGTSFLYRGAPVTGFYATSNGWLSFNTSLSSIEWGNNLTTTTQNNVLAPFWDDLVVLASNVANRNSSMKYRIAGTLGSGSAVITIEWANMQLLSFPDVNYNFQVVLRESDNSIEFNYGNMKFFGGAQNSTTLSSFTVGMNGNSPGTATSENRNILQAENSNFFSTNSQNALAASIACFSQYRFVPSATFSAGSAPTSGQFTGSTFAPANNESTGAIAIPVNTSPCTSNCDRVYSSQNATASAGLTACSSTTPGNPDDDVFFSFTTTSAPNYRIQVDPSFTYDVVVQVLDNTLFPVTCVNANGAGLTELIESLTLTPSTQYFLRIYHAGNGSIGSGEFAVCISEVALPPANDEPTGATSLTVGSTCSPINTLLPATLSATPSAGIEICTAGTPGNPDDDVWYSFTTNATAGIPYSITAQGNPTYDVVLQLFSGTTSALTTVSCVNATGNGGSENITNSTLLPNTTYYLRIYHAGVGASSGNASICVVACEAPTTQSGTPTYPIIGSGGLIIDYTAAAGASGYLVLRTPAGTVPDTAPVNGTTYTAGSTLGNATIAFIGTATNTTLIGLVPTTAYRFTVFSYSANCAASGNLYNTVNPSFSEVTTLGAQTITSTGSGLWSAPATWTNGFVPTNVDNVVIANGHTVTIDITTAAAGTLTVNNGGILEYQTGSSGRTLTVATDVTVDAGGSFRTSATGTSTSHSLSLGGSLVNNGTIDFHTNGTSAAAIITFTGTTNTNFTLNSGSVTDLRSITLNKGTTSAPTLTFAPGGTFTVQGVAATGFLSITNGTFVLAGSNSFSNNLFTSTTYSIPSTGGLWLNNANATILAQTGSPTLAGSLRVTSGTYNVGTASGNSLGFSSNATIVVEGGTINTAGRFAVATSSNTINYTQSGGTINVSTVGNASTTLAGFDLGTSTTSVVAISGGTINVRIAGSGASGPRDYRHLAGTTGNVTGGTLNLGDANSGATALTFRVQGYAPTTTVSNTSATHNAALAGSFQIFGNLTIPTGSTFDMGSSSLFMTGRTGEPGNIVNAGSITAASSTGSNFLTMSGAFGQQSISGGGTIGSLTASIPDLDIDNPDGVNASTSGAIRANNVYLFRGLFTGSNNLTIGIGTGTQRIQLGVAGAATSLAGSFDVAPNFNVGSLSLIYARSTGVYTTGFEIPSTRTVGALTVYNDAGGVILNGGALSATSVALFSGNIQTSSANLLTVTGTSSASLVNRYTSAAGATNTGTTISVGTTAGLFGGMQVSVSAGTGAFAPGTTVVAVTSSTQFTVSAAPTVALSNNAVVTGGGVNYVNGPVQRTLPANLTGAVSYEIPVGKAEINTVNLINPITTADGSVVVRAEAFDADVQGTPGASLTALSTARYWQVSLESGAANFTSSRVSLQQATPALVPADDQLVSSPTNNSGDIFNIVGGASLFNDPVTPIQIATTTALTGAELGFLTIGKKDLPMEFVGIDFLQTYTSAAGATASGTTVTVTSTVGLAVGMTVSVTAGSGSFAANTTVASIVNATQFTVSAAPTATLSGGAVIRGAFAPQFVFSGNTNQVIGAVIVRTENNGSPLSVDGISFNNTSTGDLSKYTNARVYFTGNSSTFSTSTEYGSAVAGEIPGTFSFSGALNLQPGNNYFWLTYDVEANATVNATVDAELTDFQINFSSVAGLPITPVGNRTVKEILNGDYFVGTASGADFSTITSALDELNAVGVNGPVRFLLTDATYSTSETFPITVNPYTGSSSTNTLTIKPNTGVQSTISGTSTTAVIVINGADNVIIDGSNANTANSVCPPAAASRDLTVTNLSTSTTSAVIWLQTGTPTNGAQNNIVRNVNIDGSGPTQTLIGVGSGSSSIGTSSLGTDNDNNLFENNAIRRVQNGIYSQGASTTNRNSGTIIRRNVMTSVSPDQVRTIGILVGHEDGIQIVGNQIANMSGASGDILGISAGITALSSTPASSGNAIVNATISANSLDSLRSASGFSLAAIALAPATTGTNVISNNIINRSISNGTGGDMGFGIYVATSAGSTTTIHSNTVRMSGTLTGGTGPNVALAIANNNAVNVYNNILMSTGSTGTGPNRAIALSHSSPFTNLVSNNNNLFVSGGGSTAGITNIGGWTTATAGNIHANIGAWGTAVGGDDNNSLNINPVFVSNTDLHLVPTDATNTPLATGGTTTLAPAVDIDCQTRPVVSPTPSIGADEFEVPLIVDAGVTGITLPSTICPGTVSIQATVRNNGTSTINSFDVQWQVTGGALQTTSFTQTLTPGQTTSVTLGNFTAATGIVYTVTAATSNPNGVADAIPGNDGFTLSNVQTGLVGTYTVGTGGNFATLAEAVAAYNTRSMCGAVVFSLTDGTYDIGTAALILNANSSASSINTLTIRPATGVTPTISGAVASGTMFRINGADFITIDGSNAGGTDRSLTFNNTSTSSPSGIALITAGTGLGATNITLRNLNITTASTTTSNYGINVGSGTLGSTGADNDNVTILNNNFTNVAQAIFAQGTANSSAGGLDGLVIRNNTITYNGSGTTVAIRVGNAVGGIVDANTIDVQATGFSNVAGIAAETGFFANGAITNNRILRVAYTGTSTGYGGRGIVVGTGTGASNLLIANNVISQVNGTNSSTLGSSSHGILLGSIGTGTGVATTASTIRVYYNTVGMAGTYSATTSAITSALFVGSGGASLDVRNNIFSNTLTNTGTGSSPRNFAVYSSAASSAFVNPGMDYNAYNAGTGTQGRIGFISSVERTNLAGMVSGFGQNANSRVFQPVFTAVDNLSILATNGDNIENLNARGVSLAAVTTDIDGDARTATPDIGADEFFVPPCSITNAGTATVTTAGICFGSSTTLSATGVSVGAGTQYQWEVSTTSGSGFAAVTTGTGGTSLTYSTANNLAAGTYFYRLRVTCPAQQDAFSNEVQVNVGTTIVGLAATNTGAVCPGGTITLGFTGFTPGANVSYAWTGPNGFTSTSATPALNNVTSSIAGVYSLVVTNNGCVNPAVTTTVSVLLQPSVPVISPTTADFCPNGTPVALTATSLGDFVAANVLVSSANNLGLAIPDNDLTSGISNALSVTGIPAGAIVDSIQVTVNVSHDFNSDALINLEAPNAQVANLLRDRFSTGVNFNVTLSSNSANGAASTSSVSNATGLFRWDLTSPTTTPATTTTSASALFGTPNGSWTIRAYDDGADDLGTLNSWSIRIFYRAQAQSVITWAPTTGLFTDAGGTTPYTGGPAATVYAAPSATTTYTATATAGTCTNTSTRTVSVANQWTGAQSSSWTNAANWSCGVPTATSSVTIANVSNQPVLDGNVTVASINMASGTNIGLNGQQLTVNGPITGTATFNSTATSSLVLGGSASLAFNTNNNNLRGLTVNAGTVTLTNALSMVGGAGAANGEVIVNAGAVLNANGNLTLRSNANGTARVGISAGTINGNVTVERFISDNNGSRAWRMLSVPTRGSQTFKQAWQEGATSITQNPVPGYGTILTAGTGNLQWQANGFDARQTSSNLLRYATNFNGWAEVVSTNSPMETNMGYFLFVRGDRSVLPSTGTSAATSTTLRTTGTLYQGNQPARSIANNTFALIGNIYASAIDFTGLTRTGGVTNQYWVWDPKLSLGGSLGAYQAFTGTVPFNFTPLIPGGSYPSGVANTVIESGQAFFVYARSSAGTFSLNENAKTNGVNLPFRPLNGSNIPTFRTFVHAVNGTSTSYLADVNYVTFDASFSNAVDENDVVKFTNTNENVAVRRDNVDLLVESRQPVQNNDSIMVNMWNMRPQTYRFTFEPQHMNTVGATAMLVDRFTNTNTPISLTQNTTVDFNVTSDVLSANQDRFRIVFNVPNPVPVTFTNVTAYPRNGGIQVDWKVAAELNINRYQVERSTDGRNFNTAGTVAATGNTGGQVNYGWFDANPTPGTHFFRIRSIGNAAGDVKLTQIVRVVIGGDQTPAVTVAPNPIQGNTMNVQFRNVTGGRYNLRLMNAAGQVMYTNIAEHVGGNSTMTYRLPAVITAGTYTLEVLGSDRKTRFTQTIIINTNN